jgi:hypothetical protein
MGWPLPAMHLLDSPTSREQALSVSKTKYDSTLVHDLHARVPSSFVGHSRSFQRMHLK